MHPVDTFRKDNFLNNFNLLLFLFKNFREGVGWQIAAI